MYITVRLVVHAAIHMCELHTVEPLLSEMVGNMVYISDMRGFRIRGVDILCQFESDKIRLVLSIIFFFLTI